MKSLKSILTALCLCAYAYAAADTAFGYGANATGGGSASPTLVSSVSALETALKASGNKVIIVTQNLTFTNHVSVQATNKTLLAMPGVKFISLQQNKDNSGILYFKSGSKNLILRNLTFEGPGAYDCDGWDNLCFDGVTNAWVDHCDFQDGCDGNFDNKGNTDNITISWCRFRYLKAPKAGGSGGADDHRFTNLIGSSSSDKPSDGTYSMTWAYCWWDNGCRERMTRCRNAELHFLNCYWNSNVANYYIGPEGVKAYIEGCAFQGLAASKIWKEYDGTNACKFVNSYGSNGLPSNSGSVTAPTYSYTAVTYTEAINQVTDASCGAGATLVVSTSGTISTACENSTPTLALSSGNANQTVAAGTAIANISYTAGGSATSISASNLPAGIQSQTSGLTLTLSGTPTASGTYTITASDGTNSTSKTGTITVSAVPITPPSTTSDFWNMSDADFNNLGTLTSSTTVRALTLAAKSDKNMQVKEDAANLDGYTFTHALALGGSGSITSGYRYASFAVTGNCTVDIYAAAGGSSGTRNIMLSDGTNTYGQEQTSTTPTQYSYTYSGNATTLYVYSSSSGINVYGIKLTYANSNTAVDNTTSNSALRYDGRTVFNPQKMTLKLYNIAGRLLTTTNDNVDLSTMASGMYIVISEQGHSYKFVR